jgi:hypothetical protein
MHVSSRVLWLVYERPPHADAVSYPAGEDDVRLAIELLESPYVRRRHVAEQLRSFLATQARRSSLERQRVPCRRASGWYHVVPWRLAKWLAAVLPARDSVAQTTAQRLRSWLAQGDSAAILDPACCEGKRPITPPLTSIRANRSL